MNLDNLTIEEVRAIQITDIRARLAARTAGSWLATLDNHGWCINSVLDEGTPKERMETLARLCSGSPASDTSDACFIASAADDIGVLLAEVERLTNALNKATDDHIESQRNGAREAIARKADKVEIERLRDALAAVAAPLSPTVEDLWTGVLLARRALNGGTQ
jgi:hypothetical protein